MIDLPQVPLEITGHAYMARTRPGCRCRWVPPAQLEGVALGQQRLGINLLSLIAALREEARLPFRTIQRYSEELQNCQARSRYSSHEWGMVSNRTPATCQQSSHSPASISAGNDARREGLATTNRRPSALPQCHAENWRVAVGHSPTWSLSSSSTSSAPSSHP